MSPPTPTDFRVIWSHEDQEYVGLCDRHPGLSHLAPTWDEAMTGIRELVADMEQDESAFQALTRLFTQVIP